MFCYIVCCTFSDAAIRDRWLVWLRDEHCADVCRAGALSAEILKMDRLDGNDLVLEVHYAFSSREAFEAYECAEAPRLRAEGLRFKGDDDVRFSRKTAEIIPQTQRM